MNNVVFSPDGQLLAAMGSSVGEKWALRVWDRNTGRRVRALDVDAPRTVQVGQLGGGACSQPGRHLSYFRYHYAFTPDSKRIIAIADGRPPGWGLQLLEKGPLHMWEIGSGKKLASWMPEAQTVVEASDKRWRDPYACTISPSGDYIAEGGDGMLLISSMRP